VTAWGFASSAAPAVAGHTSPGVSWWSNRQTSRTLTACSTTLTARNSVASGGSDASPPNKSRLACASHANSV